MSSATRLLLSCTAVGALVLLFAACLTPQGGTSSWNGCAPGSTGPCPCPGGADGAWVCNAEGTGYGACDCPKPGSDVADVAAEISGPTELTDAVEPDIPAPAPINDASAEPIALAADRMAEEFMTLVSHRLAARSYS